MLKEQDTKTERFAHIRRTRIIGAIGAAVAIIGGLGLAAPQQASAMTLAELDVKIDEVSADLAAKEEALQTAQDNLSAHLARVYKSGKQLPIQSFSLLFFRKYCRILLVRACSWGGNFLSQAIYGFLQLRTPRLKPCFHPLVFLFCDLSRAPVYIKLI